jgi:hypothetical protein
MMKIRAFLKYQYIHYILRRRWMLPIPVGLCLGYWASNVIQATTPLNLASSQGNALEAFIWAFGKPEIVYFVISILWVFLISDVAPENSYGQQVLLRLKSRRYWWLGKVIFVFLSTLSYSFILLASFFIPVLSKYPISKDWSAASLQNYGINLGYAVTNGTPVQAFWGILIFLIIGWFAIGLFILIINLLSQRHWPGFLGGVIVIICSELGLIGGGPIGGSGIDSFFMLQNHLEFTPLWAPVRVIPEIYSWIFWLVWIFVCLAASWIICNRQNFYAINHQED